MAVATVATFALEAALAEEIRIFRVMGIAIDLISARRGSGRCRRILVRRAGEVGRIVGKGVVDGGSRRVVVVVVAGLRLEVGIRVVGVDVVGREVVVGMRIDRCRVRRRRRGISIGCDGMGFYRYKQVVVLAFPVCVYIYPEGGTIDVVCSKSCLC